MPSTETVQVPRCQRGHELTEENVYVSPDGTNRECRICRRERKKRYKERRRAAVVAERAGAAAD